MVKTTPAPEERVILDSLPDAVMWVRPIRENKKVVDFEVGYCNQKADEAIRHPAGTIQGKRILSDGIPAPGAISEVNFNHLLEIFNGSEDKTQAFHAPYSNKVYELKRCKFAGGVLSISSNRTAQWQAERKEKEHFELLQKIIHNAPAGIVVYDAIRDESGVITDFKIKLFNEEINRLTGTSWTQRNSLTLKEILTLVDLEKNFARYCETVETGNPFSLLIQYKKTKKYLHFIGVKFGDGFISIVTDNTQKIEHEQALQRHSQYMDSILNSSQNAINTMVAIRDKDGKVVDFRYVQINKAFEKITQMTATEVKHKTMLELFPNALESGIFDWYRDALITGKPLRKQVHYVGEHLNAWYDLSIVKLDDDTVVGTFSDISEIKETQRLMEISGDRLSRFINTAQTGLGLFQPFFDETGELVDFTYGITNTSFAQYSGRTPDALLGIRVGELFPTYKTNGNFEKYRDTFLTGESIRFETYYNGDGLDLWFDTTARKMREGVLLTVNDITEVKRLQVKLEQYVEELKRSNANLEAFAYAASHDLKEPIRKITFFTDYILNDKETLFSTETKKMFTRLMAVGHRMNRLVDDLLDYSRLNFQVAKKEDIDLNETLNAVLEDLDILIEEKKGRIISDQLPMIKGQPRQIQQLFHNLLSNALKYSRKDIPPEVSIRVSNDIPHDAIPLFYSHHNKEFYLFEIRDNGIGFQQEEAEKIFNVFQRLHATAEFTGNGIGLAIVRKVIENHKGFIWAEGKPNEGSAFFVVLPKN
jgi:signal transduction histidine kinase